ncbi:vacuolar sorting protein [Anaeramoeba flamelloides]|uniref:Vacuolar sorting protein n=1 Tax=Anaeramoeba flamelloides TaxID=1746091 RepID=A0ABQ8XE47_9EUKA|nr:vacuolar sorting protein [Anaeramoeba flamelloides]
MSEHKQEKEKENENEKEKEKEPISKLSMEESIDNDSTWASELPPKLIEVMSNVLDKKSREVIDYNSFTVVSYINSILPTPEATDSVGEKMKKIRQTIRKQEIKIIDTVKKQSTASVESKNEIYKASRTIKSLFTKINQIKKKARRSETVVYDICQSIRELDNAQENLSSMITVLEHLKELMEGLNKLPKLMKKKEYSKIPLLLININKITKEFEDEKNNPKIIKIVEESKQLQFELRKQLTEEIQVLLPEIESSTEIGKKIKDCCLVIDSLGVQFRKEIVHIICMNRLTEYAEKFDPYNKKKLGDLSNLEKRSGWLKRELRSYNEHLIDILPDYWRVSMHLSEEFSTLTRNHLDIILKDQEEKLTAKMLVGLISLFISLEVSLTDLFKDKKKKLIFDVNDPDFLLQEISTSESSENENDKLNNGQSNSNSGSGSSNSNSNKSEFENKPLPMTAKSIKEKYQKLRKEREKKERKEKRQKLRELQTKKLEELNKKPLEKIKLFRPKGINFAGKMSGAFEPFMNYYVDKEKQRLTEVYERITKEETFQLPENIKQKKLKSCSELFLLIRKNFDKTFSLSKGQTFLNMFNIYKQFLNNYSLFLLNNLPKFNTTKSFTIANPKKKNKENDQPDHPINLTEIQFQVCAIIINTCEYAYSLAEQLSNSVSKEIIPELKKKISIESTLDSFIQTINQSVAILVAGIETRLEPFLIEMKNTQWFAFTAMGDQSNFVTQIGSIIKQFIPLISHYLSDNYFRFFCNKLINNFVPRFSNCIYQLRKIQGVGGSQLLMDMQLVKQILSNAPTLRMTRNDQKFKVPRGYDRYVNKELAKVEIALKVSMVPKEEIVNTYINMTQLECNEEDFRKILEMSGLNKSNRQNKIDDFLKAKSLLLNKSKKKSSKSKKGKKGTKSNKNLKSRSKISYSKKFTPKKKDKKKKINKKEIKKN